MNADRAPQLKRGVGLWLSDFSNSKGIKVDEILHFSNLMTVGGGFQDFSYGKPAEMKGLKKVFVNTGADISNRERIFKEIQNAKLDLELLDSEEGAEIILVFAGGKEQITVGSVSNGTGSLSTRRVNVGEGKVFVLRDNKMRIVMSYEGEEKKIWRKSPLRILAERS